MMIIMVVAHGVVTPGMVTAAHGVVIQVMATEVTPVMEATEAIQATATEVTPVMAATEVTLVMAATEVTLVMEAMGVPPVMAAGSSSCLHKQKPAFKAGFCRYGISVEILTGSLIMDA